MTGRAIPINDERIGLMFGHEGKAILEGREPRIQTREDDRADEKIEALARALEDARRRPEYDASRYQVPRGLGARLRGCSGQGASS